MAQDLTAAQSTWLSQFRNGCGQVLTDLQNLQYLIAKAATLGGVDAFVPGAWAGNNSDLTNTLVDSATTQLVTLEVQFYDPTSGAPTALTTALITVAPVTLGS